MFKTYKLEIFSSISFAKLESKLLAYPPLLDLEPISDVLRLFGRILPALVKERLQAIFGLDPTPSMPLSFPCNHTEVQVVLKLMWPMLMGAQQYVLISFFVIQVP